MLLGACNCIQILFKCSQIFPDTPQCSNMSPKYSKMLPHTPKCSCALLSARQGTPSASQCSKMLPNDRQILPTSCQVHQILPNARKCAISYEPTDTQTSEHTSLNKGTNSKNTNLQIQRHANTQAPWTQLHANSYPHEALQTKFAVSWAHGEPDPVQTASLPICCLAAAFDNKYPLVSFSRQAATLARGSQR